MTPRVSSTATRTASQVLPARPQATAQHRAPWHALAAAITGREGLAR